MEKHSFYFKKFSIRHDRSSMKVGTDGVLLGAWASVDGAQTILDIGTGSGVIALMLAQRSAIDAVIDAIDISEMDVQQATENIRDSPWPGKVVPICSRIQDYLPGKKYDLIMSNPPYFVNSSPPPSEHRRQSRHTDSLSFTELLAAVSRLITPKGIFAVVLPVEEGNAFKALATAVQLNCVRQMAFYSRKGKPQERWFMEFSQGSAPLQTESLVLYGEDDQWSPGYHRLLKDFYLRAEG